METQKLSEHFSVKLDLTRKSLQFLKEDSNLEETVSTINSNVLVLNEIKRKIEEVKDAVFEWKNRVEQVFFEIKFLNLFRNIYKCEIVKRCKNQTCNFSFQAKLCLRYIRDASLQYRCLTGDLPSRMPGKAITKSNTTNSNDEDGDKVNHIIDSCRKHNSIIQL